ncbi:mannitol dehydrogenase family protein [Parasedimentitalea marina]|uniref:Mannitol dehydrogenase family protein n=1 Tax=Parasedimentitalea marina TaxID=2483033 RepID=A0A3T0MZ52_9RHOB|nr:mannitol dehydrogenase family protein [Parasedimentitalea marina]AZV77053.1 mannitol dehydrogenase family protein [Parasedimentitalea marina]
MSITPIIQFGTSRFLQAHADLFISEALQCGEALGPICVVQSSGEATRARRLAALSDPAGYPVQVQGLQNGEQVSFETRVQSVTRTLSTATDIAEVKRIVAFEAEIILSNTGDAGWVPQAADTKLDFSQDMSYPAKLTHLLLGRFQAGGQPIQVMPTELVAQNGTALRHRVLEIAAPLSAKFAAWIEAEVRFVNSLVDRIVSEPLHPAGAVAEPYALWAIEDCPGLRLPCAHPAITVVATLEQTEALKLYILNLGHSYLVEGWLQRGRQGAEFVRDLLSDPAVRGDLENLYAQEVLPAFAARGLGPEAQAYVATTLDRFSNPYLDHRLADIAQNHPEKVHRRIGAFLDWSATQDNATARPRLTAIVDHIRKSKDRT